MHSDEDGAGSSKEPSGRPRRRKGERGGGGRDPLAPSPELQLIRANLEREARRFGCGDWRVAEDLIDATIDKVADRSMNRKLQPPANWFAFSITVYRNLVKSGPSRAALDRRRTLGLPAGDLLKPEPAEASVRLTADSIPEDVLALLSEPERLAVLARLRFTSDTDAAADAGMTEQHLRIRFGRALKKIRGKLS